MTKKLIKNGNRLISKGKYAQALIEFTGAVSIKFNNVEALAGQAVCYSQMQQWLEALNSIINALGHGQYQEKELILFIKILEASQLNSYIEPIEKALKVALTSRWLEGPATILLTTQFLAKYQEVLSQPITEITPAIENMYLDETLALLIERSTITNYSLEKILLIGRRELLNCAVANQNIEHYLPFISALACQTLLNHHLYPRSATEIELLGKLDLSPDSPHLLVNIALKVCYANFEQSIDIWQENKETLQLSTLYNLTSDLKLYEAVLEEAKTSENTIGIEDSTSKVVQRFYTENPYPKYKALNASTITVNDMLVFLNKKTLATPSILIAGCGTGLQAIEMAFANPKAKVTAIDLSPTSLAYARLMAEKFEVTNIHFQLLDILAVESLKQSFDFIMCTGVLHHMDSPQLGLNAITKVLKTKGTMILGLYSTLARIELKEMKAQALAYLAMDEKKLTKNDISLWRSKLTIEQQQLPRYCRQDIFNLNGVMDCLFHPQEAEYSPLEIESLLNKAGLTFEKMAIPARNRIVYKQALEKLYNETPTESLASWHDFELNNPDFFKGMINFFVSK